MSNQIRWMMAGVFTAAFALSPLARAADNKGNSDFDKINIMLEYHRRMVGMTEAYLKDRGRIPADYQSVSDREYLRRANLEKPRSSLADLTPPHAVNAASEPESTEAQSKKKSNGQTKTH